MIVDWLALRTGLIATALIEVCKWGIGRVSQSKRKRQPKSGKRQSRIGIFLPELARIASTALIVVLALTYAQSSAWTNHKQLAKRLTQRQTVMLAESYLSKETESPKLLDYLNQHGAILVSLADPATRDALLFADQQTLVSLDLLEDGELFQGTRTMRIRNRPTLVPVTGYHSKITPLGIKVIRYKLDLPKPRKIP